MWVVALKKERRLRRTLPFLKCDDPWQGRRYPDSVLKCWRLAGTALVLSDTTSMDALRTRHSALALSDTAATTNPPHQRTRH